jgi:recombination protein RecT
MNAVTKTEVAVPQASPLASFKTQLEQRESSFAASLPAHIPVERFMRVVMTAVQRNQELAGADRASLFNSSLLAAQDGLLPDGREGALVIYNTKVKKDGKETWLKAVQWMPMIAGILKKCRNSGELSSIEAHTVHANDKFSYRIGIDDQPVHEPDWFGDRGSVIGVYAVARLKDGSRVSEIMSKAEVESVRAVSRAKDSGPWTQWWSEMARKTVLRRLSKRLPISTDLDDLIRRDDNLYDLDGRSDKAVAAAERPRSLMGRLDALAQGERPSGGDAIDHDPETGEVKGETATEQAGGDVTLPANEAPAIGPVPSQDGLPAERRQGKDAGAADASVAGGDDAPVSDFPGDLPSKASIIASLERAALKGLAELRQVRARLPEAAYGMLSDDDHDALEAKARDADKKAGNA